jgi:hypothetical protein
MSTPPLAANDFDTPRVLLAGTVDYEMYKDFRRQLAEAPAQVWSLLSYRPSEETQR